MSNAKPHANPDVIFSHVGDLYCSGCGGAAPMQITIPEGLCVACGAQNDVGAEVCSECGQPIMPHGRKAN